MAYNFLIPIVLVGLVLWLVYSLAGVNVRKKPYLLFLLGFLTAISGVLLWELTVLYASSFDKICNLALSEKDCFLNSKLNDLVSKIIEVGLAALGAGLMALAIDVKTEAAATAHDEQLFEKVERLKNKIFAWHRASEKFGVELDSLTSKERVARFRQLQNVLLNIDDEKDELQKDFDSWKLRFPDEALKQL